MRHSLLFRCVSLLLLVGMSLSLAPNLYAGEKAVANPSRDGSYSWFDEFFLNFLSAVFGGRVQISTDGRWGGPTPGAEASTQGRWGGPTPGSWEIATLN